MAPSEQLEKRRALGRIGFTNERPAKVCYTTRVILAVATNVRVCDGVCVCVCGSAAAASKRTVNGSFLQAELPSSSSCVILPARHSTQAEPKSAAERPRHSCAVSLRGRSWPRSSFDFGRLQSLSVASWSRWTLLRQLPKIEIFVNEIRERTKRVNECVNEHGVAK